MKAVRDGNKVSPENFRICAECIGESFLRNQVKTAGKDAACSYCKQGRKTISIGELADHIDRAFLDHYELTDPNPSGLQYMMIKEGGYEWNRKGERAAYVIAEAAEIDEKPAEHVRQVLEERHFDFDGEAAGDENPFDEDAHYAEKDVVDYAYQEEWSEFQRSLKSETRLFNRSAEAILDSIFEGLDKHATRSGKSVVVDAGLGRRTTALYRARVFQSDSKLEAALKRPDIELAPPPSAASVAGRMNARGIAVFYGATAARVALSETRPPVGSKVLLGRFEIIRPLRLFNVEALRSIYVEGSIFDTSYNRQLEKAKFLESLSHRFSMPVMPDDEPFEYLVTQAIADYLATRTQPALDGIIYPSVQTGKSKRNIVLFHKAARVESLDVPKGTEISAYLTSHDDGIESPDYVVYESTPPAVNKDAKSDFSLSIPFSSSFPDRNSDMRDPALRLDLTSLEVHYVKRATYQTNKNPVTRHRTEKLANLKDETDS
jgi:RES domain-containing protein